MKDLVEKGGTKEFWSTTRIEKNFTIPIDNLPKKCLPIGCFLLECFGGK
jgi:hypothetical protein